jgi:amino acid transporter
MSDLDEKVKEQRKKDAVDYRTKKKNSNLFLFCGSIFEVVETILIIMVLFIVFSFLMFRVFNATGDIGQKIFSIMTIVIFVGGLVLGFIVYKKVLGWVIEKFNLEDKLSKEVLDHYKKRTKEEKEAELRK